MRYRSLIINGFACAIALVMILGAAHSAKNPVLRDDINNTETYYQPDPYYVTYTLGTSMLEYGFEEGRAIKTYYTRQCQPGDYCTIRCIADKCKCPETVCPPDDAPDPYLYLKKLVSVKDGCYWFEGNSNIHNNSYSFDSRAYGCLDRSDFEMVGVTILAEPIE